ncbi:MAG: MT-A70 family methyltransferase [Vicinamibacterales bacterium]
MKRVSVLYADPPWAFENEKTGGNHKSGAGQQYGTLDQAALERLPVGAVLAPSAVLFLWAVIPQLPEAFRLMTAWGFAYKTSFEWIKDYGGDRMGLGFWHRGGVEMLLVGIRGDVRPFGYQQPGWFKAPVGRHSAKPVDARALVDACVAGFRDPHKLELFGRAPVDGWTVLGNEIDGRDIREALRDLAQAIHT